MPTKPTQKALVELLKLHKMVATSMQYMEEPPAELREAWDGFTARYVEELEGILVRLDEQAIVALEELTGKERG